MQIKVDISAALRRVEQIRGRVENSNEFTQAALRSFMDEVVLPSWDFKESPLGEIWPPRARTYSHPMLLKTGALRNATTEAFEQGWSVSYDHVDYADKHQFGLDTMPRRAWLPIDENGNAVFRRAGGRMGVWWQQLVFAWKAYLVEGVLLL